MAAQIHNFQICHIYFIFLSNLFAEHSLGISAVIYKVSYKQVLYVIQVVVQ